VCGPEGMTLQAFASLRQLGVPKRRLHAEELSFA
jgi:ferredoxin-NADP reductase